MINYVYVMLKELQRKSSLFKPDELVPENFVHHLLFYINLVRCFLPDTDSRMKKNMHWKEFKWELPLA